MVITTAISIYGLKMSSAIWRAKLAEKFIFLGYKSSKADSDVWMKQEFKSNGVLMMLLLIKMLLLRL